MRVLVACEFSGVVKDAFAALGHDAWSCDLVASEAPGNHIVGDVLGVLNDGWDLMVAHPPCTHLSVSGARWFPKKRREQRDALEFFAALLNAPATRVCVENPVGVAATSIRRPDQSVQPWWFGDSYQKTTCLWLRGLPSLLPTGVVDPGPTYVSPSGVKMPQWFADAWNASPDERKRIRSRTFPGMAAAMARQWGGASVRPARRAMGLPVPHRVRGAPTQGR